MNLDETLREVLARLDGLAGAAVIWTVAPAVLLIALLLTLALQMRANARTEDAINRLVAEVELLRNKLDAVQPAKPPRPKPVRQPHHEPTRMPLSVGDDLVAAINEMLVGHQPYNFVESIRALDPRLSLQRLTPCTDSEPFAPTLLLENGGDGLFAHIEGDTALLFPNYSRFSATLDPKPLFDGATHGGRIHSLLRPAVLARTGEGRWKLIEKGRVHMRQGGEET